MHVYCLTEIYGDKLEPYIKHYKVTETATSCACEFHELCKAQKTHEMDAGDNDPCLTSTSEGRHTYVTSKSHTL